MTETFATRITRAPRPFDAEKGAEAAALFPDLDARLRALLSGAAGCSPYLKSLMEKERDWLAAALSAAPDAAVAAELAGLPAPQEGKPDSALRRAKRRVALLAALADLGGVWTLEEVTGALTALADRAVDLALKTGLHAEIQRGKLPGMGPDDLEAGAGMVVLAMGKMGAGELNYSSDIDLICLFDETRFDPGELGEVRASYVRATRRMTRILSDVTAEGYVFRTDLRLRPDAAVTPVCLAMETAERYYESLGRTWERAAYIKARPAAVDRAAGARFLERLAPFIWRRHLDFAAIQDAHDIRLKIRAHRALGGRMTLQGHDMKLGRGGIREIEFFAQTRQLIAGGRDPALRIRATVPALRALEARGWASDTEVLIEAYRAHREVEHRIQMIADQQTHALPQTAEGFERLAAFMDTTPADLRETLSARLERVAGIAEGFFAPGEAEDVDLPAGDRAAEIVARWPSYPALRSPRAAEIFARVRPQILSRLDQAADPVEALEHIDGFLAGLPAGVQVFSLFDANPQLIDLIVDIAATAPELARYLSRNSGVLDAVIGGEFFSDWPGRDGLAARCAETLARSGDYEAQLDEARRWAKEWRFRVGVHFLRGLIDAEAAGAQYADIAGAVLDALWAPVVAAFSNKHGAPPGTGAVVLGMGSLGAGALTATSDLDLIVIYDPAGEEASDGPRPLPARTYYARLTQALVTALTAPMAEGRLYEADMRLRPSGRQGPVATSLTAFRTYQQEEAWTWEHLALTRARAVAGAGSLAAEVEAFRTALMARPRDRAAVLADVAEMRARLAEARPGSGTWDTKLGPGRLQDIALLAQAGALIAGSPARTVARQIADGAAALGLTAGAADSLSAAYRLFWAVQSATRLLGLATCDPEVLGEGGAAFLLRAAGTESIAVLETRLTETASAAETIITGVLEDSDGTRRDT